MPHRQSHWQRYAVAFTAVAVAAACTAASAYLIGNVINEAYVNRNLTGIVLLGALTAGLFPTKGIATYGHSVTMSRHRQPHHCQRSARAV